VSIETADLADSRAQPNLITNKRLVSSWEITNSIAALFLPPGSLLVLALAGWLSLRKHRGPALMLLGLSGFGLYLLSMPYLADHLLQSLEPAYVDPVLEAADAIVVLGGSKYFSAPEYGGDTIGASTLMRLRYAARLQRAVAKPMLVSGGSPEGSATTEAAAMKQVLEQDLRVPVRWVEDNSRTTDENARFSFRLLQPAGVRKIYLLTHAWHMPRARAAFEHAGFIVVPAATAYATSYRRTLIDFMPSALALRDSSIFFHEVIGLAWYRLKFSLSLRFS
jgi:uncharacterized SAM-binding protein YcdF (DUF218 family)